MTSTTDLETTMQANSPAAAGQQPSIGDALIAQVPAMEAALGDLTSAKRLARVALTEVRKTPQLAECTLPSLYGAMLQSAQMKLEPGPGGLCWWVPRREHGVWNVQWWIGYRGMMDLARRSGRVGTITAAPIREADEFDVGHGTGGGLHHKVNYRVSEAERGDAWGYYAYAELTGGGEQFIVMNREDIDKVRASAPGGGKKGPWKDHYDPMAMKSCVRRLYTWLPTSIEQQAALGADERVSTWDPQRPDEPAAPIDVDLAELTTAETPDAPTTSD